MVDQIIFVSKSLSTYKIQRVVHWAFKDHVAHLSKYGLHKSGALSFSRQSRTILHNR
jgi:hypothetical protein